MNVGVPQALEHAGETVQSGIVKSAVSTSHELGFTGLAGDGQADLKNHGGKDKAVYAYPLEHYPVWQAKLGRDLPMGALGENFTLEGLLEGQVHIGDTFRIGTALVQVSQPRQPCFKLGARHREPQMPAWMIENGLTGFYLRVLEVGVVCAGDTLERTVQGERGITIVEANRVMHHDKHDLEGIGNLLAEPALSNSWLGSLRRRLATLQPARAEGTV